MRLSILHLSQCNLRIITIIICNKCKHTVDIQCSNSGCTSQTPSRCVYPVVLCSEWEGFKGQTHWEYKGLRQKKRVWHSDFCFHGLSSWIFQKKKTSGLSREVISQKEQKFCSVTIALTNTHPIITNSLKLPLSTWKVTGTETKQ